MITTEEEALAILKLGMDSPAMNQGPLARFCKDDIFDPHLLQLIAQFVALDEKSIEQKRQEEERKREEEEEAERVSYDLDVDVGGSYDVEVDVDLAARCQLRKNGGFDVVAKQKIQCTPRTRSTGQRYDDI